MNLSYSEENFMKKVRYFFQNCRYIFWLGKDLTLFYYSLSNCKFISENVWFCHTVQIFGLVVWTTNRLYSKVQAHNSQDCKQTIVCRVLYTYYIQREKTHTIDAV